MSIDPLHMEALLEMIRRGCKPLRPEAASIQVCLNRSPDVRAVVFNVYGTLLLSGVGANSLSVEEEHDQDFWEVFEQECLKVDERASGLSLRFHECIRCHRERRRHEGVAHPEVDIRDVWVDFLSDLQREKALEHHIPDQKAIERLALRYECQVNPVWPSPEVEQMLWKLHRAGMPLGIISDAQFFTPLFFEYFFSQPISGYGFREEACVWSWKRLEAKPSIGLFESSACWFEEALNIHPSQVLFVGNDVRNDLLPASRVGFRTALYAGDRRSLNMREAEEDCCDFKPELVVKDWSQLLECVL